MDPKSIVFDVCRNYLRDYSDELGPELFSLLLGKVRARDFRGLATCSEVWPEALSSRPVYAHLRQIEALFKKNSVFAEPVVTQAAALESFKGSERKCRRTNRRLDHYFANRERLAPDIGMWMDRAEAYIDSVLGKHEDFLDELPRLVRFTSGATSTLSRRNSAPVFKVNLKPECTVGAGLYLRSLASWFGYKRIRPAHVVSNRVEFVPKSWKTDRTIACEPAGNLPLQLAFDTYAKRQLRRRGIDLSDQTLNQRLAQKASCDQGMATIDLKSASDTLAYNTVAWLLPEPWFQYLDAIRSSIGTVTSTGDKVRYAKFSSMGNGATFALETLIFAAACKAVGSKGFSVYGDDIIIETELAQDLIRFLAFLGFDVNRSKSFLTGPFRESCGGDYYEGICITPFYLREWSEVKSTLCHNVNGLAALGFPGSNMWKFLKGIIEENSLPLVPFNTDTRSGVWIHIHDAYSLRLLKANHPKYLHCLVFKGYTLQTPKISIADSRALFLWHLDAYRSGATKREDGRPIVRSRTPAYRHKYVRKWVHWFTPVAAAPAQLINWSDYIARNSS